MVSGKHLVLDLLDITTFTVFVVYFRTQHNILSFSKPSFIAIILRAVQKYHNFMLHKNGLNKGFISITIYHFRPYIAWPLCPSHLTNSCTHNVAVIVCTELK
jgi:hypothetical protein